MWIENYVTWIYTNLNGQICITGMWKIWIGKYVTTDNIWQEWILVGIHFLPEYTTILAEKCDEIIWIKNYVTFLFVTNLNWKIGQSELKSMLLKYRIIWIEKYVTGI